MRKVWEMWGDARLVGRVALVEDHRPLLVGAPVLGGDVHHLEDLGEARALARVRLVTHRVGDLIALLTLPGDLVQTSRGPPICVGSILGERGLSKAEEGGRCMGDCSPV